MTVAELKRRITAEEAADWEEWFLEERRRVEEAAGGGAGGAGAPSLADVEDGYAELDALLKAGGLTEEQHREACENLKRKREVWAAAGVS
ncbi:MAG TPA: hypothetical protein VF746_13355 [Longimicrobium sp.]|jgi:hypothetical protein